MFSLLFDFFYNLFYIGYATTPTSEKLDFIMETPLSINVGTYSIAFEELGQYFAFICSIISLIIIVVLCCLFIGKLVKGISHLITR